MGSTGRQDPDSKAAQPQEPELELYTIPIYSSWFSWDDIHDTERAALREFFDGSSISRTPKVYKEYRDFIINRYREDPSRRLTFTQVRKALVGDVSLLHKVFLFLDKWGLINFGAPPMEHTYWVGDGDCIKHRVAIEEGAPNGIRVVAVPNSGRPITAPPPLVNKDDSKGATQGRFILPSLASYSDVFGAPVKRSGLVCRNCGAHCDSGSYELLEGDFHICMSCYKNGNCGDNRSIDDFKLSEQKGICISHNDAWTEAETLLLLESVLKHGDDWDLVAQNVGTKTKLDCILKLIELPFGEFMLGYTERNNRSASVDYNGNHLSKVQSSPSELPDATKTEEQLSEKTEEIEQNQGDDVAIQSPSKKKRVASFSDGGSSLMKQIALISAMVGPSIASSAAESAVAAICNETLCSKELFDGPEGDVTKGSCTSTTNNLERDIQNGDAMGKDDVISTDVQGTFPRRNYMPLRVRAATATALGAAAARAKLLADQEDSEIENLMASVIEMQMKKVQDKIKYFEHLEFMMEEEYAEMDELKRLLVSERIDILHRAVSIGASKWRDQASLRPLTGGGSL